MQQLSWVQKSFGGSNSSSDIASTLGGGRKAASIHECRNTNSAQECRNASELGGSQRVISASSLRGGERNGNGGGPSALNSIASTDEFERMINEQIEDLDTRPGNAAQKLHRLVQQPFRAQFGGSESRIPSSRDVEQQRAASSQRPRFTPILQGNDPEIILLDSPKDGQLHHNYQQHEQPPTPSPPSFTQQQQRPATDRHQQQPHQPIPTHSRAYQYQPRAPSPPSPNPPEHQNAHRNEYEPQQQHQSRPYSQQAQFHFDRPAAPLRSRYQSVYDLNHRPHVPPAINVDSWALGPCHYRRLYLDSLVKRIRENEQRNSKLRSQLSRFDRNNQQELDELELLYREQELEARKMQHEERLREQEQLERQAQHQQQSRTTTGTSTTSPPRSSRPLASILKKPPPKTAFAPLTPAPRVAFKSPPNRSDNNWPTSSSQVRPPSFTDLQLERDRESRRLNYVAKWHQNHEMLRQAKRRNPRINLNSNPSAIFQMVPSI